MALNSKQQQAYELSLAGHNVFITGGGGVGKSFTIHRIVQDLRGRKFKNVRITASTGVAAMLIGGVTLHSWAGVGLGEGTISSMVSIIDKYKKLKTRWLQTQVLVIDEISMIDVEFFTKLENVARIVRSTTKPFGGIQIILSGDFFQLPPVKSKGYIFNSDVWEMCITKTVLLDQIYRQVDQKFIQLLEHVKVGNVTDEDVEIINQTSTNDMYSSEIKPTRLYATNASVDKINMDELRKLGGETYTSSSIDNIPKKARNFKPKFQYDERLMLKVGAQVMLLKNIDVENGLVNGSRGVVVELPHMFDSEISIKFMDGNVVKIPKVTITVEDADGTQYSREQYPLKLAWATTIHKSQGQTLDLVEMDLGKVFEESQCYVALSRGVSLDKIKVTNFDPKKVKVSQTVLDFYAKLK